MPLFDQLLILEVHNSLTPEDQKYYRESREKRFGTTLEKVADGSHVCVQ